MSADIFPHVVASVVCKVLQPELCTANCCRVQSESARLCTLKLLLRLLAVLFLPCESALLRSEGVSKLLNDVLSLVDRLLVELADVSFSDYDDAMDERDAPGLDWTRLWSTCLISERHGLPSPAEESTAAEESDETGDSDGEKEQEEVRSRFLNLGYHSSRGVIVSTLSPDLLSGALFCLNLLQSWQFQSASD